MNGEPEGLFGRDRRLLDGPNVSPCPHVMTGHLGLSTKTGRGF